tara:strand:+ start:235 stop:474 length:240 start_codon:yes stop_codon:yes gene_type:complete
MVYLKKSEDKRNEAENKAGQVYPQQVYGVCIGYTRGVRLHIVYHYLREQGGGKTCAGENRILKEGSYYWYTNAQEGNTQ